MHKEQHKLVTKSEGKRTDKFAGMEEPMAKLRHIAVTVPDMQEAATFYEKTFGMERVFESGIVIMLSDGTWSNTACIGSAHARVLNRSQRSSR